jgi:hypothetical protein
MTSEDAYGSSDIGIAFLKRPKSDRASTSVRKLLLALW